MNPLMTPLPRYIRIPVLIAASIGLLSGVGAAGLAVLGSAHAAWAMFGFELVIVVASVLALLVGMGRLGDAPGLALVCMAGTVFVAGVLGAVSVKMRIGSVSLMPLLMFRVALAGLLALLAAAAALCGDRDGWRRFALGIVLGIPVVVVAGAILGPWRGSVLGLISGLPDVPRLILTIGGGLILAVLLCASPHLLISAFSQRHAQAQRDRGSTDPKPT